jgi:translation initiation factor 3 subunit B
MTEKSIAVYETPSMELCDKLPLKVPNVRGYSWSPSEDILAYWVAEEGDIPAKVCLVAWPSRELVAQKNLFNVCDATMEWHPQGDFLCVRVSRFTKSKKSTYTNFEIFRMRGRAYPVESLEVRDAVVDFAFEPRGDRFVVIRGVEPLCSVDMYSMGGVQNGKLVKENTLEKKALNKAFWSPIGGVVLLAGVKSLNGTLEWYEAATMDKVGGGEHFMITDIAWDPTGRFVVTAVSHFRSALEAAYQVWTSHGALVTRQTREKFFQLLWRPRPPSLVTAELERDVTTRLKEFSRRYDREDASAEQSALNDLKAEREEQRIEFAELCREWHAKWVADRPRRAEIRGGAMSDNEDDWEEIEVLEEEILRQDEEVVTLKS